MKFSQTTNDELLAADEGIPRLAAEAFRAARERALATRGKVMEAAINEEDGKRYLVETLKDGTRRWIKELPPLVKVVPGSKVRLKAKPTPPHKK